MRPEDIFKFIRKQPFEPFRITLTYGRTYDVMHPELAMVGRLSVVVGLMRPGDHDAIFDRSVDLSILHIMQLEKIQAAPAGGNGSAT